MNDPYQTFALDSRNLAAKFNREAKPVNPDAVSGVCESWEERQERFAENRLRPKLQTCTDWEGHEPWER